MNRIISGADSKRLAELFRGVLFVILLLLPVALFGQAYFGTVSGEMTDPSGAVVPGAKVVLTTKSKGFVFNTTTDSRGRYLFTSIPPGVYTVSVEMEGFQKEVRTDIRVNVTENATANLRLKVASATQSVEVSEQAQQLTHRRCRDRPSGQPQVHQRLAAG